MFSKLKLKIKLILADWGLLSKNEVITESTLDVHSKINGMINALNKREKKSGLSQEEILLHGLLMEAQDSLADCYDLINKAFPELEEEDVEHYG